jgi:hypothetical protein
MLLSFVPTTDIDFSIVKFVLALAMELIVGELAYILNAIGPREFTKSLHLAILPLALVAFSICPVISTGTFNDTFSEFTRILGAVSKEQNSFAMLLIKHVEAFKLGSVWPIFCAMPMLFAMFPLTSVHVTWFSVGAFLDVACLPMGLAFSPATLDGIAIRLCVFSDSMRQIVLPLAFVNCSIGPNLLSITIFLIVNPLSLVNAPSFRTAVWWSNLSQAFIPDHSSED